jgi:hypothetical protein
MKLLPDFRKAQASDALGVAPSIRTSRAEVDPMLARKFCLKHGIRRNIDAGPVLHILDQMNIRCMSRPIRRYRLVRCHFQHQ